MKELESYFIKTRLIQGLPKGSVEKLFKFLDINQNDSLSINEVALVLKDSKTLFKSKIETQFTNEFI